jgi:thiol-disulfide isomerase/thioredoxin
MRIRNRDEDLEKAEVLNSLSQNVYQELDNSIQKIKKRWQTVTDTLYAVNKRSNTAFQELKGWVLTPYFEEIREAYLHFFKQYPHSYVTAYYLHINVIEMNQGVMTADSLYAYYERFPDHVKNSMYGKRIIEELQMKKIAIVGTMAIDFIKPDLQGQSLSLSSFRGKYVLLDFWGSWCVPCRKGNPHLKELYSRYKSHGFEIIGIAADNNSPNAWREAIEKDGLPWHHILIDKLNTTYNIKTYPTKILIDKDGVIIGRFGEDAVELDKQLASIFNF